MDATSCHFLGRGFAAKWWLTMICATSAFEEPRAPLWHPSSES